MRKIFNPRHQAAASLAALAFAIATPAHATDAAEGAPPAEEQGTLEQITVTAQKTETGLEKTPIAITALSSAQLDQANIRSTLDLDKQVPGMTVSDSGAFPLVVTIRGVGFEGFQNNSAQPGVALVQNGVYIASPAALTSSFLDLAQLEVLRGPQGTVNGQNADGGALNITTALPQLGKLTASGEGSYGSYNYYRLRGMVNLPIGENFALRAALQREAHDGWLYAPNQDGIHVGDQRTWSGRVNALWQATDRLSFNVWGEFYSNDSNGLAVRNMFDPAADPRTTSNDFPTPQKVRSQIVAGTIAYDFGFARLKSITSYQNAEYSTAGSGDLLSFPQAVAMYGVKDQLPINDRTAKSWTQEFNLASAPGGKLDWIIGAFYLHTKGNYKVFEVQQTTPVAYTPNFDPTPAELGALWGAGLAFESIADMTHESTAGYGQATYHFTDHLRLTGGLRYSWDKSYAPTSTYYAAPVPLYTSFKKITGKVSVEADIARGALVYASYSTGVKPGGTNLNPGSTVVPNTFSHEMVRAYEIGSKNELFGRTLRLNISAFYNDYRNLQVDSEDSVPYLGGMTNIPKSHILGIEGELAVRLPAGFRIDANASVTDSKVDSHVLLLDPYIAQGINRTYGIFSAADLTNRLAAFQDVYGNKVGRAPPFSTTVSLSKTSEIGLAGTLDAFVQLNYRSPFWFRVYNNPVTDRLPAQFVMSADVKFQSKTGPWYVELQVTNLTGSHDVAARYAENFGVGAVFDSLVPPRQFVGRVGFNF